ncbi:MAG: AAA domain-containing protein [Eubacteriales bacterium]|nr:AAA domain-containing protein [Eubacteriales bacterium]
MIIVKGEFKTKEVNTCSYNPKTKKWYVIYNDTNKTYSYSFLNVEKLKCPKTLDYNMHKIETKKGELLSNIVSIYEFMGKNEKYLHICFKNDVEKDYKKDDLIIIESCLNNKHSSNIYEYIKQLSKLSEIKNVDGENILSKRIDKLASFIGEDVVLSNYLNPKYNKIKKSNEECIPIFPFGCNNNQYKAVKNAIENNISVIQGPPGTGKTQTILNIIANILIKDKNVLVVANNNSAIINIFDKLSSSKYGLDFMIARLGKSENKKSFINEKNIYPDFSTWLIKDNGKILQNEVLKKSQQLKSVFDNQEMLSRLRQELSEIITEKEYFNQYLKTNSFDTQKFKLNNSITSNVWMDLWQGIEHIIEEKKKMGILFKLKIFLKCKITDSNFYKQQYSNILISFQNMYYYAKQNEILIQIKKIEKYLKENNNNLLDCLTNDSLILLKNKIANHYKESKVLNQVDKEKLMQNYIKFLDKFPIVLSTTFSSKSSLGLEAIYDYIIMDEASQVDIVTGALALSCARNAIIVGDTKQLPNVITEKNNISSKEILKNYDVDDGYKYTNSFLQSILEIIPEVPQVLLCEHYRCHPKIINFCNQKFYRGELVIMTKDNGEKNVISAVRTVEGNHERDRYNQREIDVITKEILPTLDQNEIGIITPYKNQVKAILNEFTNIEVGTVHSFQGREKDNIIISFVDDSISDFVDDPNLINVAVSRAKKKLVIVVNGNKKSKDSNINDLIEYIQYNNFEVLESKIYSIFDYLYKQYTNKRNIYLQKKKKISQFDSENIMYSLIKEIINDDKFSSLDVISHFPLNMLIKDNTLLNDTQKQYVFNPLTHLDFLIYNTFSKKPILAIEVDGYKYHKEGSAQFERDEMKNEILKLYEIPMLRFKTNGSGEKEKIIYTLENIY